MYWRRNEASSNKQKFHSCVSEQCKNVSVLSCATGPSLNLEERVPISSNHHENYGRWQQMLNAQSSKMTVNGASKIGDHNNTVIKQYFGPH
jgi:hypothetical protein